MRDPYVWVLAIYEVTYGMYKDQACLSSPTAVRLVGRMRVGGGRGREAVAGPARGVSMHQGAVLGGSVFRF